MADKKYDLWSLDKIQQEILDSRFINLAKEQELCFLLTEKAKLLNDHHALAFSYTYLSDYYLSIRDYSQCYLYLKRANALSEPLHYDDLLTHIYNFYGMFYNSICDSMTSLDYYMKVLRLAESHQDFMAMAKAYNNIATCFDFKHNYKEATNYYNMCYHVLEKVESDTEYSKYVSLTNLCNCAYHLNDKNMLHKYLLLFDDIDKIGWVNEMTLLHDYCRLLEMYVIGDSGLLNKAEDIFQIQERVENKLLVFQVLTNMCDIFLQIDEAEHTKQILEILNRICEKSDIKYKKELQILSVRYHAKYSDQQQQLEAYKEYYEIMNVLENIENEDNSSGLIAKMELQKAKEAQVSLEKERNLLEKMMNMDDLTMILNRRCLNRTLQDFKSGIIAIAMLDIDCFKQYNDIYGHQMGDYALSEVAKSLQKYSSEFVTPFRYGGDEFTIIFLNQSEENVENILNAILEDILSKKIEHTGSVMGKYLSISYGFAVSDGEITNIHALLKKADDNLYLKKKTRKGIKDETKS